MTMPESTKLIIDSLSNGLLMVFAFLIAFYKPLIAVIVVWFIIKVVIKRIAYSTSRISGYTERQSRKRANTARDIIELISSLGDAIKK